MSRSYIILSSTQVHDNLWIPKNPVPLPSMFFDDSYIVNKINELRVFNEIIAEQIGQTKTAEEFLQEHMRKEIYSYQEVIQLMESYKNYYIKSNSVRSNIKGDMVENYIKSMLNVINGITATIHTFEIYKSTNDINSIPDIVVIFPNNYVLFIESKLINSRTSRLSGMLERLKKTYKYLRSYIVAISGSYFPEYINTKIVKNFITTIPSVPITMLTEYIQKLYWVSNTITEDNKLYLKRVPHLKKILYKIELP